MNYRKPYWITESIYVDIDTGEIIDKQAVLNGSYRKLKSETKYKHYENYKSKTITTECRRSAQQRIFKG